MTGTTAPTTRRSRRLLVPMATLLAASGIALASGADFTTATASTGVAASGTLTQLNSNTVAFNKENLKPGDVVTGSVTITNTGSLPAQFTLAETTTSNTFAPTSDVTLQIVEGANVVSAVKTLGTAGSISLGTFAPGASKKYDYTVTFKQSADNTQQGKRAETRYAFTSTQLAAETFVSPTGAPATSPN